MSVPFRAYCVCACLSALFGCSFLRAAPAPTTPFLQHRAELHSWYDHAPWDAVWSADPGKIMVKTAGRRKIFVAPISVEYLNRIEDSQGKWVPGFHIPPDERDPICDMLRAAFQDAIRNHPETNLVLVESPDSETFTVVIALVELVPTKRGVNAIADVGGFVIPGAKVIDDAARVGAQSAGAIAAGTIAIEIKMLEPKTGEPIAEIKDRESDPISVLPNYRDFEKFGWSRLTIREWGEQFAEVFGTPVDRRVPSAAEISILPW